MQTLGTHRSLSEIRVNVFLQIKKQKTNILATFQHYVKSCSGFGTMLLSRRVQVIFFFWAPFCCSLSWTFLLWKFFHFVITCVQKEVRKLIDAITWKINWYIIIHSGTPVTWISPTMIFFLSLLFFYLYFYHVRFREIYNILFLYSGRLDSVCQRLLWVFFFFFFFVGVRTSHLKVNTHGIQKCMQVLLLFD